MPTPAAPRVLSLLLTAALVTSTGAAALEDIVDPDADVRAAAWDGLAAEGTRALAGHLERDRQGESVQETLNKPRKIRRGIR